MGIKRTHVFWTVTEERVLREMWPTEIPIKEFMSRLSPERTYQSVIAHARNIGLGARPMKVRSTYSAVWDEIERVLARRLPLTGKEIARRTGHSQRHVSELLQAKLRTDEVHVHAWRRCGNAYRHAEVWALGDGPNAQKPKAKTRDDINRLRRARRAALANLEAGNPFGTAVNQVLQEAA